ncbi:MAG: hypothetical protein R3B47_15295 [Bacteroidia bacterium]
MPAIYSGTQPVNVGDTLRLPVFLGVTQQFVDSAYGLAFSISYTQRLVDGDVRCIPDSTWLGRRSELISIQHDDYTLSLADLGLSRTDQTNRMSYGQVARLDIVIVDDIIGKRLLTDTLNLRFENVELVTASGYTVDVNALPSSIVVEQSDSATNVIPDVFATTKIYPSPASETLTIFQEEGGRFGIELYDMHGKLLLESDGGPGLNCK